MGSILLLLLLLPLTDETILNIQECIMLISIEDINGINIQRSHLIVAECNSIQYCVMSTYEEWNERATFTNFVSLSEEGV